MLNHRGGLAGLRGFADGGEVGGASSGGLAGYANALRAAGRPGTFPAHINPDEARQLWLMGGRGTVNDETGLPEFAIGGPVDANGVYHLNEGNGSEGGQGMGGQSDNTGGGGDSGGGGQGGMSAADIAAMQLNAPPGSMQNRGWGYAGQPIELGDPNAQALGISPGQAAMGLAGFGLGMVPGLGPAYSLANGISGLSGKLGGPNPIGDAKNALAGMMDAQGHSVDGNNAGATEAGGFTGAGGGMGGGIDWAALRQQQADREAGNYVDGGDRGGGMHFMGAGAPAAPGQNIGTPAVAGVQMPEVASTAAAPAPYVQPFSYHPREQTGGGQVGAQPFYSRVNTLAEGGPANKRGGLAVVGDIAANRGRGGDSMVAHITPDEASFLRAMGGSGSINPATGLPEFFKLGNILKYAAPALAVAGLGAGLYSSGALDGVFGGAGDAASGAFDGTNPEVLGSGTLPAASDAGGGWYDAPVNSTPPSADIGGPWVDSAGGAEVLPPSYAEALNNAPGATADPMGYTYPSGSVAGPDAPAAAPHAAAPSAPASTAAPSGYSYQGAPITGGVSSASPGFGSMGVGTIATPDVNLSTAPAPRDFGTRLSGFFLGDDTEKSLPGRLWDWGTGGDEPAGGGKGASGSSSNFAKYLPAAITAGGMLLSGGKMNPSVETPAQAKQTANNIVEQQKILDAYRNSLPQNQPMVMPSRNRTRAALGPIDWTKAGQGPLPAYYSDNTVPGGNYAHGGPVGGPGGHPYGPPLHVSGVTPNHVRGPGGGRDDQIPAMLDDGEHVMDSEFVSLLGDGDNELGSQRLDQLREYVRRHKGGALARGKISPRAPHVGTLARVAMQGGRG